MKTTRNIKAWKGSVLMEFVIAMPLYIVMLGGIFLTGDAMRATIRLAGAERLAAFGQSRPQGLAACSCYADTSVQGPWTVQSAARIDKSWGGHLAALGVAGQLAFGDATFRGERESGDYAALMRGSPITIHSKDVRRRDGSPRAYAYNFYTLRRARPSGGGWTWRDNRRYSSDLVADIGAGAQAWRGKVFGEKFHPDVSARMRDASNSPAAPFAANGVCEYVRYGRYVDWSE